MLCMRMVRCCAHVSSACAWCAAARMVPLLAHAHGALLRACVWCLRMHMTCCCEDVLGACACARCAAVCIFLVLTHGVLLRVSSADVGKIGASALCAAPSLRCANGFLVRGFAVLWHNLQHAVAVSRLFQVCTTVASAVSGTGACGMSAQTAAPWLCQSAQGGNAQAFTTVLDCLVNGCG